MPIKIKNELIFIIIWTAAAAWAALLGFPSWLRIILGPPIVLFFPGYCFVAAVCPARDDIRPLPRLVVSTGLSLVLFPVMAVLLHYTPQGITVTTSTLSLAGAILFGAVVGWLRRSRLPPARRLTIEFRLPLPAWKGVPGADRALSIGLIALGLFAAVSTGLATLAPRVGERYTEFYLEGQRGSVLEYPRVMRVGTQASVVVGILNQEGRAMRYRVEGWIAGAKGGNDWAEVLLDDGQRLEKAMSFTPPSVGDNQRVDFRLYKEGDSTPYRYLYFWLNVKGKGERFTEFYLNRAIKTEELHPNGTVNLSTVVVNHEEQRVKYRLVFWQIQYGVIAEAATVTLGPEERWAANVRMRLKHGGPLTVHYQLYVGEEPQPRQTLRLYLEVSGT
ncbi:MAG: DUF1616 domain-containing protein [Chloroflexi bacterium]|nr:DUF1616 domain-containing protein [Chloroflexota bacterium]